jgi:hypothetical protein
MGACGVDRGIPLHVKVVHEPPERALGDGCAVVLAAETTTGCLMGSSGKCTGSCMMLAWRACQLLLLLPLAPAAVGMASGAQAGPKATSVVYRHALAWHWMPCSLAQPF